MRLLGFALLFVFMFAVVPVAAEVDKSRLDIEKEISPSQVFRENVNISAGSQVVSEPSEVKKVPLPYREQVDLTTLLKWYNLRATTSIASPVAITIEEVKKGRGSGAEEKEKKELKIPARRGRVRGYCWFDQTYRVTVEQYVTLPCVLSVVSGTIPGRTLRAVMHAKLVPAYSYFSLVVEPVELEDMATGVIYRVTSKVVYDAASGSANVADKVNRQLLKKALAYAAISGMREAKGAYREYATNRYTTKIYGSGDSEFVAQETRIPASYPVTMGLIGATSAFFEGIINAFRSKWEKFPAIFIVNGGKRIYVDMKVEELR